MTEQPSALAALTTSRANLGLRPGEVTIVDHDTRWTLAFEQVAQVLRSATGDLEAEVEHVGSTSVHDLAAKPVLDIAIGGRPAVDDQAYITRLEAVGCEYQADLGDYGGLFFWIRDEDRVLAHIHVVARDNFQWRWYLAFRNALRAEPALRTDYEQLKRASATEHATSREEYTQAKFDWILSAVNDIDGREN